MQIGTTCGKLERDIRYFRFSEDEDLLFHLISVRTMTRKVLSVSTS